MRAKRTHYEVLGVQPTASAAELKTAYRRLLRQTHPDLGGSSALVDLVTEAYSVLKDPAERAAYDASLQRGDPGVGADQQSETHRPRPTRQSAPSPEPQPKRHEPQPDQQPRSEPNNSGNARMPYDPRPPLKALAGSVLAVFLFLVLPFAFLGRTEDPYSFGDDSEINGFGWLLILLMVPAGISIARRAWDIVRPSRWSTHAFWWEAGPDVARTLAEMPPRPPGGEASIGWHLASAVMTMGMSSFWHLARAAAAADKAEQRQQEWRTRCAQAQARAEAAMPSTLASLAALEQRYRSRWTLGDAHRRSLDARLTLVAAVSAHLKSAHHGDTATQAAHRVTLRMPLHRIGLVGVSVPLAFVVLGASGALASDHLRDDRGPLTTSRATGSPPDMASPTPEPAGSTQSPSSPTPTVTRTPLAATPKPKPKPKPARTSAPPVAAADLEPTCASLSGLRATYSIATKTLEAGVEKWPRVTIRNSTNYTVVPHFSGGGKASSPDFPEFPLEMNWPNYDSEPVAPGTTATFDVGKSTGLILYVPPGGRILRFDVSLTVDDEQERFGGCKVALTRKR